MGRTRLTSRYLVHGLEIAVRADNPRVLAALHARIGGFAGGGYGHPQCTFEYRVHGDPRRRWLTPPEGEARRMYEPPLGEVLYYTASDELFINHTGRVRVLCEAARGRVRIALAEDAPDAIWVATHPLFTLPFLEVLKRWGRFGINAVGVRVNGVGVLFPAVEEVLQAGIMRALERAGFKVLGPGPVFLVRRPEGLRVLAFPKERDISEVTPFSPGALLQGHPRTAGEAPPSTWAEDAPPEPTRLEVEPAFLLFPTRGSSPRNRVRPMSRDDALLELLPNVLVTEPVATQAHLDILSELVETSAAYRFEVGTSLEGLSEFLWRLVG
ncbi:hypothetical protein [Marinithermus hydrothermalis]|uniref:Uncharacterized protein n=1 Tax=Marinithermus hydrothermalis (strain DSM 14884 / JCM 11576 / T1) TaxID=869210 RepID=F2NKG5_MARHT|nr:hypothetical protein [Marinithermus hydrothermalis]AEB12625.1 hypothetical protein Marky_1894 [Marinithermus hydrothermalis DSM 14884]